MQEQDRQNINSLPVLWIFIFIKTKTLATLDISVCILTHKDNGTMLVTNDLEYIGFQFSLYLSFAQGMHSL